MPLSSSVTEAPLFNPETVPPMVKVVEDALHATLTVVTFLVTVPEPAVTVQVSPVGSVPTVTS